MMTLGMLVTGLGIAMIVLGVVLSIFSHLFDIEDDSIYGRKTSSASGWLMLAYIGVVVFIVGLFSLFI